VLAETKDQIAWVTLNRPEKSNAMSPALCYDMVDVLTRLAGDDDVRILVLTGAGEAFSAGMDLKLFFRALDDDPAEKARARSGPGVELAKAVELSQTDHRHGQRLLLRRGVHPAGRLRHRHRGRGELLSKFNHSSPGRRTDSRHQI
jgi:hypothetical protein